MKFSTKILWMGTIVATAIILWQKNHPPVSEARVAREIVSEHARPVPPEPFPVPIQVESARPSVDIDSVSSNTAENTFGLLHLKLRQWRESEIHNPDDEEGREQLLKEMLAMVTDGNVAEIIQSLTADEMNTPFGTGALHHWMQKDPVTASNWLASRPDTTAEQTLAVAEDWNKNRDGLKQYLDQLPDTAWKQSFLEAASSGMSLTDPLAAIKLAQQMKPGDAQVNLLSSVACAWVDTNPDAALNWINSISDPSLREQLVASAAQSYALTNPGLAAAWLVSEVKSDETIKPAVLNIVDTWVSKNPAQAAKWVAQFPGGDTKGAAADIISKHWQQTDPAAAAKWIQNVAQGLPPTN